MNHRRMSRTPAHRAELAGHRAHLGIVRDVCVIGLGLIGGSLLRAATKAGRKTWGAAESTADAEAARSDGFDACDSVAAALARAQERDALVVVAVPLPAVESVLREVAEHAPRCLLTDVTGVKQPVSALVRRLVPEARFVGGHPMAGTTSSGWRAGDAGLFAGASWALCLEHSTELTWWAEVAQLALELGAEVVPVTPEQHDAAVARISHLPHVLAAVLASVGADGGPLTLSLAAGSFTDGTRVAGTRVELTRAMTEGNRAALLPALDAALGMLGAARGSLASTGSLGAPLSAGHAGAQALAKARDASHSSVRIDLRAPDAGEALLALGEQGGRVSGLRGTVAVGRLPTPQRT